MNWFRSLLTLTTWRQVSSSSSFRIVCARAGRKALPLFCAAFMTCAVQAQPSRADAEKDPVLKAMLTELNRSMSQLQLPGFARPFFIQYRIEDVDTFETRAEFGATEGTQHMRQRVASVTVRVGSYKADSSGGRGDGSIDLAALDDDTIAIRSALWEATDRAYKSALDAYARKQAALKEVQTPPQADDFSHEKPIVSLAPPIALACDESAWAARVARLSGLYRSDPVISAFERDVQYSQGTFRARAVTTWIVNSEGTLVRKSSAEYQEAFSAGTQAPDGMSLDRSYASTGTSAADLETETVFNKHAADEIASLAALRKAPRPFNGVLPDALAQLDRNTLKSLDRDLGKLLAVLHKADKKAAHIPLADL